MSSSPISSDLTQRCFSGSILCRLKRSSAGPVMRESSVERMRSRLSREIILYITSQLTDRHKLTYERQKLQGKSPGANGGSVQRLVRHSDHSISKISGLLCPKLP